VIPHHPVELRGVIPHHPVELRGVIPHHSVELRGVILHDAHVEIQDPLDEREAEPACGGVAAGGGGGQGPLSGAWVERGGRGGASDGVGRCRRQQPER
jgi:hypothetical protein